MTHLVLIASACGLIAALSWGIADFFAAKASKKISPESVALWVSLIGVVVYTLIYPLYPGGSHWSSGGVGFGIGAGLFMGAGLLLFYRGLAAGPVSIVSPIGSAYPLVTTLIVLTLFGGTLSNLQVFGIFLVVAGIIAASGIFQTMKSQRKLTRGVLYALPTFVLWGVAFAFIGQAVSSIGWQKATFVEVWSELLIIVVAILILRNQTEPSKLNVKLLANKFVIGTALLQLFGIIIFDVGLTITSSSAVITAISASYPALTVFLALKHLNEEQSLVPLLGGFVTVIGVMILSLP